MSANEETKTRRPWVKLWVQPWFDSSLRVELSNDERGVFVDILALAGKSRWPGMIASGRDEKNNLLGYPLRMICNMMISWKEQQVERALEALKATNRITVRETPLRTGETGIIIEINSWAKYQSEYERTKRYQNRKSKGAGAG